MQVMQVMQVKQGKQDIQVMKVTQVMQHSKETTSRSYSLHNLKQHLKNHVLPYYTYIPQLLTPTVLTFTLTSSGAFLSTIKQLAKASSSISVSEPLFMQCT